MPLTTFPIPTLAVSGPVNAFLLSVNQAAMRTGIGLGTLDTLFVERVVLTRSSLIGPGVTYLLDGNYTAAPAPTDQPFGIKVSLDFNGSSTPTASQHGSAILGWGHDTALNRHGLIGLEGKVDATGLALQYIGVSGDTAFVGASFSGALYGFAVTRMSITTDGTTPLASGAAIGLYIPTFVGGALKLGIFCKEQVRVDNFITAYGTDGAGGTALSHDGNNGTLQAIVGSLYIRASGGTNLIIVDATNVTPMVAGTPLGTAFNPWTGKFASGTTLAIAASVTPVNNGELMFQATSNTSLTFKYKGSDGTVRSGSIVLI